LPSSPHQRYVAHSTTPVSPSTDKTPFIDAIDDLSKDFKVSSRCRTSSRISLLHTNRLDLPCSFGISGIQLATADLLIPTDDGCYTSPSLLPLHGLDLRPIPDQDDAWDVIANYFLSGEYNETGGILCDTFAHLSFSLSGENIPKRPASTRLWRRVKNCHKKTHHCILCHCHPYHRHRGAGCCHDLPLRQDRHPHSPSVTLPSGHTDPSPLTT
jgi:hypothetical protein